MSGMSISLSRRLPVSAPVFGQTWRWSPSSSSPPRRQASSSTSSTTSKVTDFRPKNVLILTKFSRYDFEQLRHPTLSAAQLEQTLRARGSNYNQLLYHHYIHKATEQRVQSCLQEFGLTTRIVNRFAYTEENIDWADVVITTGGDGTFLMGASRIQDREKPVIGFNTDPSRSEGYLCLPKRHSINIHDAVRRLVGGAFHWTFRKRIRITLVGDSDVVNQPPVELHDQQLLHPEYRFYDDLQEKYDDKTNSNVRGDPRADSHVHPRGAHALAPAHDDDHHVAAAGKSVMTRVLPALALNEVYFGECVSARVSYFEVSVDGGERVKTKNAGLCVSTGTGSTSWSYNISKVSAQTVEAICDILTKEQIMEVKGAGSAHAQGAESAHTHAHAQEQSLRAREDLSTQVARIFNNRLTFHAEAHKMNLVVRDPISTYTLPYAREILPRGFATNVEIRSRCFDASVVIDGGLSFPFNDGTLARLDMFEADALRTVMDLHEDN